jgi:DNA-binding MarR family transcriptional regulator
MRGDLPGADDDFVGCLAGNLRAATRAVTRFYDDALRPLGLRITQVSTLAQLRRLEPVSVTELANALGSERSGVARDVAVLERAGFVTSRSWEEDFRVRHLSLTEAGRTKLEECAPVWRATQQQMRELLGADEVDSLVAAATGIGTRLGEGDR